MKVSEHTLSIIRHQLDTDAMMIREALRTIATSARIHRTCGPPNFPEVARRQFDHAIADLRHYGAASWSLANDLDVLIGKKNT